MTYKGYKILRGEVLKFKDGRRKGSLDIWLGDKLVNYKLYTVGNHPSRAYAVKMAKDWVDKQLKINEA